MMGSPQMRGPTLTYLEEVLVRTELLNPDPELLAMDKPLFSPQDKVATFKIFSMVNQLRKFKMLLQDLQGILHGTQTIDVMVNYQL